MFGVESMQSRRRGRDKPTYISAYPGLNWSWNYEFGHPPLLQRGELIAGQ